MSSSPLTMALLGQNGMMPQDPAYLPVARRLGLAQAMMGQGLESGPASPMQALARVVQGGLGAWMQSGAEDQFNDVTKQRQQDTLNAIQYMRGGAAPGSGVLPQAQPDVPAQPASAPPAASASLTPLIQQASLHSGVPAAQLVSMVTKESGGKPDAVNQQSGAGGVAQILPSTAAQPGYGVQPISDSDRFDAAKAIPFAADYVAARAKAAGLDMTNPDQAAKAWSMYGGDKTGAYGADVVAKAGGAQPAPGQSGTAPPAAGQPQTGVNAPMVQQGMTMMQRAQDMAAANPYNVAIQHAAAAQIEYAKTLMGMDTFVTLADGTQMNSRTRQIVSAAQPLPHYVTTPTGSEDTTGTHPPTYMPSPRVYQTPAGEVGAVGSGGQITPIAPANNSGVAARASASSQGAETGKAAVVTSGKMYDLGHEADTAIGNIDYGLNQLHQAAAGGIQSGYFAPWLAPAAAAGKSLGIDLKNLGIDPAAVGNVQSAQKTLGVVAGTILQNTIGKDSQITDAKIEHFIHTQPGIETDPQAIDRIMNWARSQFTYNREMAMDAMHNTDASGMLPAGWRAQFIAKKGAFAPIYDPLSGEMKQPTGEGPAPQPPGGPAPTSAAPAAPQPPVPGAKMAPDGKWYVPDPARGQNKYLRVDTP